MPITVKELVEKAGLNPMALKKVKWGTPVKTQEEGVYIVSLSETPNVNKTLEKFPISMNILKTWIDKVDGFKLDGKLTYNLETIKHRLSKFWLFDENVLYIGKASNLRQRIRNFYNYKAGNRGPHAGGYWIKLLKNLKNLYVYYIECPNCNKIEGDMMRIFEENVSDASKKQLSGTGVILPFANLEDRNKNRKKTWIGAYENSIKNYMHIIDSIP